MFLSREVVADLCDIWDGMSGSGLEVYHKRSRMDMKHFFTEW